MSDGTIMAEPARPSGDRAGGPPRRAGPWQVMKAVLSAFVGIRKGAAHDRDMATITPVQAIVAGIIAAAIFVLSLVFLVKLITS